MTRPDADSDREVARQVAAFERLYPRAPRRGLRLQLQRPPIGVLAARRWHHGSLAVLVAGLWLLLELQLLAPGGTVLGFGVWWFVLAVATTGVGLVGYAWSANRIRARGAVDATTWHRWAGERGFRPLAASAYADLSLAAPGSRRAAPRPRSVGSTEVAVTPSRDYGSLYAGRVGGVEVVLGNCYVHGPRGTIRNAGLGVVAALVRLPADAGRTFPASVLDRFLVGRRPVRSSGARDLRELRLESIDLDEGCELRVAAASDDVDWYTLLDPAMVEGLAREWPVSWQQAGTQLVVYAPAPVGTLDAAQLDTVCAAAAAIGERFRAVAARDASHLTAEETELARQRASGHRRRRRVRDAVAVLVSLAVLATPIVLVTRADAARDDRRSARLADEREQFAARYAVGEVVAAVQRCQWAANAAADVGDTGPAANADCADLPERERAAITGNGVVTEERLRDVDVARDGPGIRVELRSDDGVRYAAVVDVADPDRVDRSCRPTRAGCPEGRWPDRG